MHIRISRRGQEPGKAFLRRARQKVESVLGRFSHQVESVEVALSDGNGSSGESDRVCRLVLKPRRGKSLSVSARALHSGEAISRAIQRARNLLARRLDSLRTRRRAGPGLRALELRTET